MYTDLGFIFDKTNITNSCTQLQGNSCLNVFKYNILSSYPIATFESSHTIVRVLEVKVKP